MIKRFWFLIFILSALWVDSQNWDSIKGGLTNDQIEGLFYDSINNELIASGKFINNIGGLPVRGIARWNGSRWDSLKGGINTHNKISSPGAPLGMALCGISYNGKLLVGGCFNSVGGINATGLALWDGAKWDSLPKRAFDFNSNAQCVSHLFKKGNLLYIAGSFTAIGGQPCNGLATWDGNNFNCASTYTFNGQGGVSDIIEYQNDLYISGGYFYNPPDYIDNSDILKFDGSKWVSMLTGGFKGNYSGATSMAVYNNELYVGGHFLLSAGNPGENIMKWNGVKWQDVGFGGETVGQVRKLLVHNNKLWAFGCFYIAANIPAFSVAVYDGNKWCGLQDTLDNCLLASTIYKDTIYVGGGFSSAGGDSHIANLAKLKNENVYRNCNGVGIKNYELSNEFWISPNPAVSSIELHHSLNSNFNGKIEITNSLGHLVMSSDYNTVIDITSIPSGLYLLKIKLESGEVFAKRFVVVQ